jgi:hypothetical protein
MVGKIGNSLGSFLLSMMIASASGLDATEDLPSVSGYYEDDDESTLWESSFLSGKDSVEAVISTAKARFVLDNPGAGGGDAKFSDIAPYIVFGGKNPSDLQELEARAGEGIVSLGRYPGQDWEGIEVLWGEKGDSEQKSNIELGDLERIGAGFSGGGSLREKDIEDAEIALIIQPVTTNPTAQIFKEGSSKKRLLYKKNNPLFIKTEKHPITRGGLVEKNEILVPLTGEYSAVLEGLYEDLIKLEGNFPSLEEQIEMTLPPTDNWITAQTVTILWRGEGGAVHQVDVVSSVTWTGAGALRGVSYSRDVEYLVEMILNVGGGE